MPGSWEAAKPVLQWKLGGGFIVACSGSAVATADSSGSSGHSTVVTVERRPRISGAMQRPNLRYSTVYHGKGRTHPGPRWKLY